MNIAILGDGRVGRAIVALLDDRLPEAWTRLIPFGSPIDLSAVDLTFGCLPGGLGPKALEAALDAGVDLIDVADLDPPVYAEHAARVIDRGIRVIHGGGLSPGLLSAIAGYELEAGGCTALDVAAGSLSDRPHLFPFLWCFEDMVAEFEGPSLQVLDGVAAEVPAWSGLRSEQLGGVAAESYYCQSGFEELAAGSGLERFTYRNLRPEGFHHFFRFLRAHGAFEPARLQGTRVMLEAAQVHNRSLGRVVATRPDGVRTWWVESRAEATDALNSMQRVTAAVAVELARLLLDPPDGAPLAAGLWPTDSLGRRPGWLDALLPALRGDGVRVEVTEAP